MRVLSLSSLAMVESLLLLVLVLVPTVTVADDEGSAADVCPLECENGGTCQLGSADYSKHPTEPNGASLTFLEVTSREGWFCDCPDKWTGIRCGREYEVCFTSTGDDPHFCYHGGKCIDGLDDTENVASNQRFCDCSNAQHNGIPYFGKYCEIEGAVQCAPDSEVFCTAHGVCEEDFENKAHPCNCPEGHRGPHCEFLRDQVPDCVLQCENGGECTLGFKDYEQAKYKNFWSSHSNFQYCSCPSGWFGEKCEVPGVTCGNAHCFNGGACLETLNDKGETTYACDCATANHNGKAYAGQYCEAEATSNCANEPNSGPVHPNGHLFCTNKGTCKESAHLGCDCPNNFHGPRCEFYNSEDAECTLECQNGGSCRKGKKDNSLINSLGKEMDHFNISHSQLFEHCVCPDGYFGIQCEHKMEICPGGDHVCLHGSKCIPMNEGDGGEETNHKCDCDQGFDAVEKYAGKFCQYTSTDICTKDGKPGVGKANFAFCVNNGICKRKVNNNEHHPGCICEEGFTGEHCEFLKSNGSNSGSSSEGGTTGSSAANTAGSPSKSSSSDEANQSLVVGISAVLIAVIVTAGFFVTRALVMGRTPSSGKTGVEAGAAVAAAEQEAAAATALGQEVTKIEGQQPFDEDPRPPPFPAQARFEEGDDGDFEDVEDYSNDQSDTSTLTEDDMSNVEIV